MESLESLVTGFGIALLPQNLLFALIGSIIGTFIGVMPGVGPAAGVAILIPLTFNLPATGAIIMLAAIYYGAQYGGTITSVLLNVPGESSSAVTCIDGYQMAKQGRGGVALSMAAIGSFIGGTLATIGLIVAAPPLARMALHFGPPEFFALMVLGVSLVMGLAGTSIIKALMMGVFGLLLATIGMDPTMGSRRFTFGQTELLSGLDFVPVIMGLFGVGDVLVNAEMEARQVFETRMSSLMPSRSEIRDSVGPILRGTGVGFFLGLIPGVGATVASFMSYVAERKVSRHPGRFGSGALEGVVGPETANNAYANAALIPLFTLGIPGSATVAVLMGAFMMNGLTPGPFLFVEHPDFVWAVIASLNIGNVMLLILNLPLIGIWVQILKIPYSILFPLILAFTLVGAYSVDNNVFGAGVLVLFGVVGYFLKKLDFPLAPVALTLILGPLMEKGLRASLEMSQGSFAVFFTRPISLGLLVLAGLFLLSSGFHLLPFGSGGVRAEDAEV